MHIKPFRDCKAYQEPKCDCIYNRRICFLIIDVRKLFLIESTCSTNPYQRILVLSRDVSLVLQFRAIPFELTSYISPNGGKIASSKRSYKTQLQSILSQSVTPFGDDDKSQIWKLSYRLWNACVDISNAATTSAVDEEQAKLRQISSDLLFLAGDVEGIPSPAFKSASFFYKTGLIWHDLKKLDLASNCFERATDLTSKNIIDLSQISHDAGEKRLLVDLNIARSRTAWETSDRILAVTLLNRSKNLLFGSPDTCTALANQYLMFAKLVLSENQPTEALKLMNEALELCEKGMRIMSNGRQEADVLAALKTLELKTLRFMAGAHLQGGEFESVLKCIRVLREGGGGGDKHPSLPVLSMKAWLGLGRHSEAEKELKGMVVNKGIPEGIWLSAIEAYFQEAGVAGAETAKGLFLGLLERCHVSAGAAVRIAHRVLVAGSGGEGSQARAKIAVELVSDDRVMSLFAEEEAAKERMAMHAVLWNCGAEHFRSRDYVMGAELFEKSMLYVPHNEENRVLRAKCFRVLCLCYIGLSQLDRAQEYINEAKKLHPNVACGFLKFKIYLQKNDANAAVDTIQTMTTCIDFTPDFLLLSAHEAIASQALPVAIASLSNLLKLYSPGKAMPTPEVVVVRSLVAVLAQNQGTELEILKFTRHAQTRMLELGLEQFFGKGEIGTRERNWFAVNSWNIGIKIGKEKKYALCAEFLELASEFYGVAVEGDGEENGAMVFKALISSVSALIAAEKQESLALPEATVKHALELLDKATKILKSIQSGTQHSHEPINIEPRFSFALTFNTYELRSRLVDPGPQQLLLVKNLASSKNCTPHCLLQIGLSASAGPRFNPEVADYALNTCLSDLLASPFPDFQTIAIIIRKLIGLAGFRKGKPDEEVHGVYKQAYRIMVGLKEGEYPVEEAKWLAITAWNRAALPLRLGQLGVAKRWMKMGLDLAQNVAAGMESSKRSMEDFLADFKNRFEGMEQCAA
ncbi:hypothetical protein Sjap_009588 [Stephania japonica]|uniref:Protein ZIP4 homolog n=1 Tax=Stephania japonica TaxID=461633 RepID=A0AAP0JSF6_9MAGN